jgi:Tfp pilus assembly protein PilO
MLARLQMWAATTGLVVLLLAVAWWRVDATAYDRGVRDQKIKTIGATEVLNAALREARAKTTNAALDAENTRRELTKLERELANERAQDPLAGGQCISPDGLSRVFRVP